MTIKQYEIVRNRLDGILGSKSRADLKVKRLQQLVKDLFNLFHNCRFAIDLHIEIMDHIVTIDSRQF